MFTEITKGERVYLPGNSFNNPRILKVTHITKTMFTLTDGYRYRRSDGRLVGESSCWQSGSCTKLTPELEAKVHLIHLKRVTVVKLEALQAGVGERTEKQLNYMISKLDGLLAR